MKMAVAAMALAAFAACGASLKAQDITLFDGEVKKGWSFASWGGATLAAVDDPSNPGTRKVLKLSASNAAKPWAGGIYSTSDVSTPGEVAVPLTPELRKSGKLSFVVNGSDDEWGNHKGEQKIQVAAGQKASMQGKWSTGSYSLISGFIEGKQVDSDPTTWQKVEIPLSQILPKEGDCIGSITFQFYAEPSQAGLLIDKIKIVKQ